VESACSCPACGHTGAVVGQACPGCGAGLLLETATVERWRGYVSSSFVLRAPDGTVVAESSGFRTRGGGDPAADGPAAEALEALAREAEELGWLPLGVEEGASWFERRFGCVVAVDESEPAEELQADEHVEPVPAPAPVRQVVPEPVAVAAPVVLVAPDPRPAPVVATAAPPPPPRPAPPEQPADRRRTPRRSRSVTIVSVAGLGVAAGLGYLVLTHGPQRTTVKREVVVRTVTTVDTVTVATPARSPASDSTPASPPRSPAVAPQRAVAHLSAVAHQLAPVPGRVRLHVTAMRTSWLEIRRGSSSGDVVYVGNLEGGRSVQADAARLWVRFASAGNVVVRVNGKPVALTGTLERTFVPARD
jgi:uncharacterized protein DUF4115